MHNSALIMALSVVIFLLLVYYKLHRSVVSSMRRCAAVSFLLYCLCTANLKQKHISWTVQRWIPISLENNTDFFRK